MSSSWDVETGYQFEITWIDLRVVMFSHGNYLLYHIPLRSSDKAIDVMPKLKRSLLTSRGWWTDKLTKVVPFLTPVVYNATMCPVPIEVISQDLPCVVDIGAEYRCHILTKALNNPREFPAGCDFVTSYRRFTALVEAPGTLRARDVLLIRLELDKLIFSAFVLLSLILSIICGVVAGFCWKSLDTGLGVFGAVIGVDGVVMGILAYFLN
ncbi:hypothetical protein T069G_05202 [Trichoderma breve]|uniref:Uncharacterized protein n=1 Tax=Trichoderma breve TaxID=2034170 RepID=A0A9W9BF52_9HYPO|nr:hypothetical protein T069G_05202 [Trichoderma breve]KAJ4860214.1 hypothetical protein T069G_05202 [Trichoderma breve]